MIVFLTACASDATMLPNLHSGETMPYSRSESQVAEPTSIYQLRLPIESPPAQTAHQEPIHVEQTLARLMQTNLTFKGRRTNYATHNLHAFAAKWLALPMSHPRKPKSRTIAVLSWLRAAFLLQDLSKSSKISPADLIKATSRWDFHLGSPAR